MTKAEILDGLEGLKDLTNETGKKEIANLKAAVGSMPEVKTLSKADQSSHDHAAKDLTLHVWNSALQWKISQDELGKMLAHG
jgi:hypothetical protein